MNPIWVLVNCNSSDEAQRIGDHILDNRLGSCYDIFLRKLSKYFWPAKSSKKEKGQGALLIVETFENKYQELQSQIKKLHSDKLPFIGYINILGAEKAYIDWIQGELVN